LNLTGSITGGLINNWPTLRGVAVRANPLRACTPPRAVRAISRDSFRKSDQYPESAERFIELLPDCLHLPPCSSAQIQRMRARAGAGIAGTGDRSWRVRRGKISLPSRP
jgi:hypothetical protein